LAITQDTKVTKILLHIFGYRLEPNREIFPYYFSNEEIFWLTRKTRKHLFTFSHFENHFSQLSLNLARKKKRLDCPPGNGDFLLGHHGKCMTNKHKMGICSLILRKNLYEEKWVCVLCAYVGQS
jgi:hypothetical protein